MIFIGILVAVGYFLSPWAALGLLLLLIVLNN